MEPRRAFVTQMLEQLLKAVQVLSDEDFDKLMKGELVATVSFVMSAAQKQERRQARAPLVDADFGEVHARLTAAGSRDEGQRIVEESFASKEQLFAFAKWLDLPVQRNDAAKRIRDKVVMLTVGRRLSGKAVRGDGDKMASGDTG